MVGHTMTQSALQKLSCDPFDLEAWPIEDTPQRIYGDAALSIWGLVDPIDYPWASQWCWSILRRPGRKPYLKRTRDVYAEGYGRQRCEAVYLHVEIMKRTGIAPPTPEHVLVDHIDYLDTLNNCRHNLRWATYSMNNRNR